MMVLRWGALLVLILTALSAQLFQSVEASRATLVQEGDAKKYCPNCGMDLVKFYKTSHVHENHHYCSMHCLYEATKGVLPKEARVVDTNTLAFIDAYKAFYVVGSKMRGTMSQVSQYAFGSQSDAEAFMAQYGGKLVDFKEAYGIAKQDFEDEETANVPPKASVEPIATKITVPKDAKCPVCGMFVAKNPQWAASLEIHDKVFYFDGVKDMMKYVLIQRKHYDMLYVTNYYKLTRINAKEAFYVIGSNVYGPMGSELIPFATEKDAAVFAKDHNGKAVLRFDQISAELVQSL